MNRRNLRCYFAVALLFVLVAEWGSHSVAFAHAYHHGDAHAIQSGGDVHEDLCSTLILGSDGSRQDQPVRSVGHQPLQENVFAFDLSVPHRWFSVYKDPRLRRTPVGALTRPAIPAFHPPEFS